MVQSMVSLVQGTINLNGPVYDQPGLNNLFLLWQSDQPAFEWEANPGGQVKCKLALFSDFGLKKVGKFCVFRSETD